MRVPRVAGNTSNVYTWQNYYLNNSEPEVGGRFEIHAYRRVVRRVYCYVGALIDRKKGEFEKQHDAILYFAFRIMY